MQTTQKHHHIYFFYFFQCASDAVSLPKPHISYQLFKLATASFDFKSSANFFNHFSTRLENCLKRKTNRSHFSHLWASKTQAAVEAFPECWIFDSWIMAAVQNYKSTLMVAICSFLSNSAKPSKTKENIPSNSFIL